MAQVRVTLFNFVFTGGATGRFRVRLPDGSEREFDREAVITFNTQPQFFVFLIEREQRGGWTNFTSFECDLNTEGGNEVRSREGESQLVCTVERIDTTELSPLVEHIAVSSKRERTKRQREDENSNVAVGSQDGCDNCLRPPPPSDESSSEPEQGACRLPPALRLPLVRLPPPMPVRVRRPRFYTAGEKTWIGFVMHHDMRGDMYTMAALMLVNPDVYVVLLYREGEIDRLNRHYTFFRLILGEFLGEQFDARVSRQAIPAARLLQLKQWQLKDPVKGFYRFCLGNRESDWYKRNTNSREWGDILRSNNNLGFSTFLLGEAFRQDRATTYQTIRRWFTNISDELKERVRAFIDRSFPNTGKFLILWNRQSDNGPEWNLGQNYFLQLSRLVRQLNEQTGPEIQLIPGGEPMQVNDRTLTVDATRDELTWLQQFCSPRPGSLVSFWTQAGFPEEGRADMRVQLYFWDCLINRAGCTFVALGMRSGFLELLALLWMNVYYMEVFELPMDRTLRMRQWYGLVPYNGVFISEYPGPKSSDEGGAPQKHCGKLKPQDLMRIYDALFSAFENSSAVELERSNYARLLPLPEERKTIELLDRRFWYPRSDLVDTTNIYSSFLLLCGGQSEGISNADELEAEAGRFACRWEQKQGHSKEDPDELVAAAQILRCDIVTVRVFHILSCRFGKHLTIYVNTVPMQTVEIPGSGPTLHFFWRFDLDDEGELSVQLIPLIPVSGEAEQLPGTEHEPIALGAANAAPAAAIVTPPPPPPPTVLVAAQEKCVFCGEANPRTLRCGKSGCGNAIKVCGTFGSGCIPHYMARLELVDSGYLCLECLLAKEADPQRR